jgi:hypothetical protein
MAQRESTLLSPLAVAPRPTATRGEFSSKIGVSQWEQVEGAVAKPAGNSSKAISRLRRDALRDNGISMVRLRGRYSKNAKDIINHRSPDVS